MDEPDDEISLQPYFETLWRYRRVIAAAPLVVAAIFVIVVLGVWLWLPAERLASLQFRLLFEGAAQNRYPNDTAFSPTEIVAAPVVAAVFKANDLQRFGKYEDFKDALFVQQSNPELDLLAYEYQAKLADPKLTPVDRARIEGEFKNKREALLDPSFALSLRRSERFAALPREVAQKVLTDTLATWAQQAQTIKGVLKYPVPILSSRILSPSTLDNDYLVAADLLRAKAVRVIGTIDQLEELPGALTLRTAAGTSLPEIRAALEDSIRFDLEPLLGIIRSEGITKNARLLSLYASNMVFQLQLDKEETEGRARALQNSLREYVSQTAPRASGASESGATGVGTRQDRADAPALMPQLSESFLDRLEAMSVLTQKGEMEYRRKLTDQVIEETRRVATFDKELQYYEGLNRAIQGVGSRPAGSPELVALITRRSQNALEVITKATNALSDFYNELSAHNLSPEARLYAITGPFTEQTVQSLSRGRVVLAFALAMMLTLVLVPAGCLIHDATRRKKNVPPSPAAGA